MDFDLPPPSEFQTPEEHMAISRRFIKHANEELDKGERLQASEKAYAAASHALTAVGLERGWQAEEYRHKRNIARYLSLERDYPRIRDIYNTVWYAHENFYKNTMSVLEVQDAVYSAEHLVEQLEQIRKDGPKPVEVKDKYEVDSIRYATGFRARIGETYTDGFVNQINLDRYERRWAEAIRNRIDEYGGEDTDRDAPTPPSPGSGPGGSGGVRPGGNTPDSDTPSGATPAPEDTPDNPNLQRLP